MSRRHATLCALVLGAIFYLNFSASANPGNRVAMLKYYDRFLNRAMRNCTVCHLPAKDEILPTSLENFPHNAFGKRLASLGVAAKQANKPLDLVARLKRVANEDADGDGTSNEIEILLGRSPGDPKDTPTAQETAQIPRRRAEFQKFIASYRWQPFETFKQPTVPKVAQAKNPIDAFLLAEMQKRNLKPRPPASKEMLLRRVSLDLTGLAPTLEELRAFEKDASPNAYAKVVDRLLASPRYGERWGKHWMDVWRYSDWAGWADGGQIRDSRPHIWRWRDWIIESLNKNKGYDRMVMEMLAADEIAPNDPDTLRATGFLARNFKLLSREQWMEDVVAHTSRAFLGVTMHCAKCHDHMYEPISQKDYYRFRAIFEPHNVRDDRIPGAPDTNKNALVRTFDADPKAATYLLVRGDERHPDKNQLMPPGVPSAFGGNFTASAVALPPESYQPHRRAFILAEETEALAKAQNEAIDAHRKALSEGKTPPETLLVLDRKAKVAAGRYRVFLGQLRLEEQEAKGEKDKLEWVEQAKRTLNDQRLLALMEANLKGAQASEALANAQADLKNATEKAAQGKANAKTVEAQKSLNEAEKQRLDAEKELKSPLSTAYKPREAPAYPTESTGRRLALARWIVAPENPLAARVAANHLWARHFGTGITPTTSDFGRNGRPPSHPLLLDWLAKELIRQHWQMKPLHRLIVLSDTYRRDSRPDPENLKRDPDNIFLWRMPSRRLEAEIVRDNMLYTSGLLDETRGGPEVDHTQGLVSLRRSLYLRTAAEKQSEFLMVWDAPSVTECYERRPSVLPQQALSLANSSLALEKSRHLARNLAIQTGNDAVKFIESAFLHVLARRPTPQESRVCTQFLTAQTQRLKRLTVGTKLTADAPPDTTKPSTEPCLRARENLILALFNHNDFVTVR